jgi:hypothetical protein
MRLARNYATHWHTRPSVGETCPCTSVQHGATDTVSTYLNAFVCSAVVGRACRCKISAKYGCSVTTALYKLYDRLVFITEAQSVYSAVRTDS